MPITAEYARLGGFSQAPACGKDQDLNGGGPGRTKPHGQFSARPKGKPCARVAVLRTGAGHCAQGAEILTGAGFYCGLPRIKD